jgi:hypothetical protein
MAAGLGYIEFNTGDVLTAAQANGYLASQVVMVFASAAARTSAIASPQEGMFSYLKDTNSTEYYSGSAWVAVGGGGGGGKVLQVVNATTTTTATIASNTYADSGITATITPTASTSKVLIIISANQLVYSTSTTDFVRSKSRIMRGATQIIEYPYSQQLQGASSFYLNTVVQASYTYLDSPATTSATTYKLQGASANSHAVAFQDGSTPSVITLLEIGA